jgi:NAD(P)-dependent dehydrogenase (short-subunit alcohol dehydrogenase family)
MLKNKIALVTGGSQGIGKAITAMMIDSAIRARAAATGVDVEVMAQVCPRYRT